MAALPDLTIAEAREGLRAGSIGAVELTEACLAAAEGSRALNAFSAISPERARAQATAAAARLKAGDAPDLCGIPLGIKDLFCVEGLPAQAASNILGGFRPPYESTVTRQLWDAGAVCIGKLNIDEFAMGI
jgi:aspartyl-tRNA(Asn)/glutamyl-tRNA(Gln) amidotransferase subunit A